MASNNIRFDRPDHTIRQLADRFGCIAPLRTELFARILGAPPSTRVGWDPQDLKDIFGATPRAGKPALDQRRYSVSQKLKFKYGDSFGKVIRVLDRICVRTK